MSRVWFRHRYGRHYDVAVSGIGFIGTVAKEIDPGRRWANGWASFTLEGKRLGEQPTRDAAAMQLESYVTSPARGDKRLGRTD